MLWLRTRRASTVLPVALLVFIVLVILVQNTSVALPSLTGRSQVALSLFVPIPLVSGLMMCLESRLPAAEISGIRPVRLMDAALAAATVSGAVAMSVTVGMLLDIRQAGAAGRNALFLTGLMLIGRALVGQPAVMIPVGWLLITVFVGFRGPGDPYPWSIVAEAVSVPHAAFVAVLVFIAGITAQLRTPREMS